MAKKMNFKEFIEYANQHYNKGGDSYVECWDENTFKMFYPNGVTKAEALKEFRRNYDEERDMAGFWY